ncbi:MAG: hypothetical protein KBG20_01440 [Caldilineaceae bacterium]|nr:hypothetical protein [Caldilineaceae bacterium]MBP8108228.1 hypothetical protein [Caldilineaceae bacterium]MBP8124113.1 hypothetical protein [Caldilineaceae bacterium]MBP9070924.1 hypothetical protein [Caldilineaceae bacterium]
MADQNPYVGPRTFTYADRNRYFGRENEAQALLARVISQRLVLFYAQSGAGKSSLINTRLVPDLRDAGFGVLPVGRVGGDLPDGVSKVGNIYLFNLLLNLDASEEIQPEFANLTLTNFLGGLVSDDGKSWTYDPALAESHQHDAAGDGEDNGEYENAPYVLIIDQFEEIVTTHNNRWLDRADFFQQLNDAMQADPNLWVVLTLREDYVAALDPYARYLDDRMRARFYMERMGVDAARQAISQPAENAGRPFAAGVAATLVDNLRQIRTQSQETVELGQYLEPVQLQVVCYQLWENLETDGRDMAAEITQADLEKSGDVDSSLASFYESAIQEVLATEQSWLSERELRIWFDTQLITDANTRGTIYRGKETTAGMRNRAVDSLQNRFLLRTEVRAGGEWVELVHDRFVEPIQQADQRWRNNYHNPVAQAYERWQSQGQTDTLLLNALPLDEAQRFAAGNPLDVTAEEQLYLQRSHESAQEQAQAAARAEQRRHRTRLTAIAVIVVLTLLTAWALFQSSAATTARNEAVAQADLAGKAANAAATAEAHAKSDAERAANAEAAAEAEAEIAVNAEATAQANAVIAEDQARRALASSLAGQSQLLIRADSEPGDLALILARDAVLTHLDSNTDAALRNAFANAHQQGIIPSLTQGHQGAVNSVAYSPDGQTVVSGGDDGTIRLWQAHDLEQQQLLFGHTGRVLSVGFSPDGKRIVSGSDDNSVRIWDVESGETVAALRGHTAKVLSVSFSPDGKRIVSGSDDSSIRIWDVESGEEIAVLLGHTWAVDAVLYSPDGKRIVSGGSDNTIRLWDAESGEVIATLDGHSNSVRSVAYSPDGKYIASGSDDRSVRIWDTHEYTAVATLSGNTGWVNTVSFSPDGKYVSAGDDDGTVVIWNAETYTSVATLNGHADSVRSVAWSPLTADVNGSGGQRIASGSGDGAVRIWDVSRADAVATTDGYVDRVDSIGSSPVVFRGHTGTVWSVAFSPDGEQIVSGGDDGTARIWDATNGMEMRQLNGFEGSVVWSVSWSPATSGPDNQDGERIVAGIRDHTVRFWSLKSIGGAVSIEGPTTLGRHDSFDVYTVAISPDGERVASGSADKTVRIWNVKTIAEVATLEGHTASVNSVGFSPSGGRVVSGSTDNTVRIWDVKTGEELAILRGHTAGVNSVAYSPDGDRIVSGSDDSTVRIWDAESGEELASLRNHMAGVKSVAFSPDGKRIASGSDDSTVRIWDAETGEELAILRGHTGWVNTVAFSPDGKRIASGSDDNTVRIWDGPEQILLRAIAQISRPAPILTTSERQRFGIGTEVDLPDQRVLRPLMEQAASLYFADKAPRVSLDSEGSDSQQPLNNPTAEEPTVTDGDGNTYKTVQIGEQLWMAENLRTTTCSDGSPIPFVIDKNEWITQTSLAYTWSSNVAGDQQARKEYGALYNGYSALASCNICPSGWHVPSGEDFQELVGSLNPNAHLKLSDPDFWGDGNNATNSSGWSARPGGGDSGADPKSYGFGKNGNFWSTSEEGGGQSLLVISPDGAGIWSAGQKYGFSIRCVSDQRVKTIDTPSVTIEEAVQEGGYYRLQTRWLETENKCLEGNRAAFMDDCREDPGQLWKLVPIADGYYQLQTKSMEAENKCLEGNQFATGAVLGGAAFMDTCQEAIGQLWSFEDIGDGYYHMQTRFSEDAGTCLEGNTLGQGAVLEGAAFMDACSTAIGQSWKIIPAE